MATAIGCEKSAARRVGCELSEYRVRVAAGEKWCTFHKCWHRRNVFGRDRTRSDGLAPSCLEGALQRKKGDPS